jgi:flotillin
MPDLLKMFGPVVLGALAALGFMIVFAIFVRVFIRICGPNEALIVSGLGSSSEIDGKKRGFRPVIGGRCFSLPGFSKVDRLSLALMEVPISVRNAYSSGGIAMNVEAIANVKISSDERVISNAVERFLNRSMDDIRRVAKETLEGHLRGVVATLTPEQVNEDRLVFADALTKETEDDLQKLGMHLDTLKILHVGDEVGYLDATGRKAIANVVREAEISESDARRSAEQAEAENQGRANVTKANTEASIAKLKNELRTIEADLKSKVNSEEERTTAAAREARATAEQHLQLVRAELEALRLQADTVLPAEAAMRAQEFRAQGEAASIRERGRAVSEALTILYDAWKEAGPNAKQITIIENLEQLMSAASQGVSKVQVESLQVIDSGDGQTLPNYLKGFPNMLGAVFEAVEATTGVDIPGTVSGTAKEKR